MPGAGEAEVPESEQSEGEKASGDPARARARVPS
jgi:hypothetical protein